MTDSFLSNYWTLSGYRKVKTRKNHARLAHGQHELKSLLDSLLTARDGKSRFSRLGRLF